MVIKRWQLVLGRKGGIINQAKLISENSEEARETLN